MNKRILLTTAIFCMGALFLAAGIYAGTTVADTFKLEDPGYKKHTKAAVDFSHKKHATDYGATCGDCHHDDTGKALDLKEGDNVQKCGECHSEFGKLSKEDKKMKKAEKIKKYHKEALHANCISCHKDANKKAGNKNAPTKCNDCHPKKKK